MPLHKSSRAPRLDPTMISAPLGDFRHTMHIGRGGDAFGDTSFLSTLGPSPASPDLGSPGMMPAADPEVAVNHSDLHTDAPGSPQNNELQHSESVSSFTLDLDLDLGPSMLGDVLGVMDGLGLDSNEEDAFKSSSSLVETKQGKGATEMSMNVQNELNGKNLVGLDGDQVGDGRIPDGNGIKPKGLKPKVRFSDKREEIIRQASEEEEGQGYDFQDENQLVCMSPTRSESERGESRVAGGETEFTNHKVDLPPSPASSHSSEYEGVTPLDRRRVDSCHSETDSDEEEEEEEEAGRGYTFEDEFDDEIGL
ncbi:cdc42 effector protein 5 [Lates calcarifer]|uniref:Cdc42 effector protein 5 n=1 Tax=Lates calcarifer TaxID=8187 RepID=A0AAJ7PT94_LATCA|nr:cdc42 effector protein 5 [Lates calcarifer]